jgi:hypothetical protein
MALTPEEQKNYFATQNVANPLSPTQYEATLRTPQAITPAQMEPATPVNFGTYTPPAVPTLQAIDTQIQDTNKLGATEQQGQDIASQMLALTRSLTGKEAYRATQDEQAGVNKLLAQQTDLTSQYNALVNENATIPLQLQQELMTRPGVSVRGAVGVEQTARLRENAIKALTVNSLLQSTQGNLTTARATSDRAVNLKYADQEAQLEYLQKANEIIKNSPAYSMEEKARAAQQSLLLQDRATLIANQKETEKGIQNIALKLAEYGMDPNLVKGAKTIDEAIMKAGTALQDPAQKLQMEKLQLEMRKIKAEAIKAELESKVADGNEQTYGVVTNLTDTLKSSKIGAGTKTLLGTIMGVLNAAEDFSKFAKNGEFPGVSPVSTVLNAKIPFTNIGIPFRETFKSKEATQAEGYINGINLKIQQWASGAALTDKQTEQVEKMTPRVNDTDAKVREKLNNLSNFMQAQIKGSLASEGIDYNYDPIDYFKPTDTLEDIFK